MVQKEYKNSCLLKPGVLHLRTNTTRYILKNFWNDTV